MTDTRNGTISSKELSTRQSGSESLVDDDLDFGDENDDTDALPFLSLAVDRLIHGGDDAERDLNPGDRNNAANDALDSDATAPLPILDTLDVDTTASVATLDAAESDATAPLPVLDALDSDATGPLPTLDAPDSDMKTSPPAIEAERVDDDVPDSGLWAKIKTYIGF